MGGRGHRVLGLFAFVGALWGAAAAAQDRGAAEALIAACKDADDPCKALELCQQAAGALLPERDVALDALMAELIARCGAPREGASEIDEGLRGGAESGGPEGFVSISAGKFKMGTPRDARWRGLDEESHVVELTRGFQIQSTEVTQAQWREVMGEEPPSTFVSCGERCPVERVTWYEAVAYANALSLLEGRPVCYLNAGGSPYNKGDAAQSRAVRWPEGLACIGWRLPTEAEWEYAARADVRKVNPEVELEVVGANRAPALDGAVRYAGNSGVTWPGGFDCDDVELRGVEARRCGPAEVGTLAPNAWGLSDMLGNVWEWVWDEYAPYDLVNTTNPGDPTRSMRQGPKPLEEEQPERPAQEGDPEGSLEQTEGAPVAQGIRGMAPMAPVEALPTPEVGDGLPRVTRGCSWISNARHCRAAFRGQSSPSERRNNQGFRVARTLP